MNVELLLQELSLVSKKFELINKKTGGYVNIFEITDICVNVNAKMYFF